MILIYLHALLFLIRKCFIIILHVYKYTYIIIYTIVLSYHYTHQYTSRTTHQYTCRPVTRHTITPDTPAKSRYTSKDLTHQQRADTPAKTRHTSIESCNIASPQTMQHSMEVIPI